MKTWFGSLFCAVRSFFETRASLQLEIVALWHQLIVLRGRQRSRVQLNQADRMFLVWLSKVWSNWRSVLVIVKPETVIGWQPQCRFRGMGSPKVAVKQ